MAGCVQRTQVAHPSKHNLLLDVCVHIVLENVGARIVVEHQRQLHAHSRCHSKDRSPDHVQGHGQWAQGKRSSNSGTCKGRVEKGARSDASGFMT